MAEVSLKRQLEMARFQRAFDVTESLADHRALLTTVELERINVILIGSKFTDVDPWRQGSVTLTLPSGKTETLALIGDPKNTCREKLHQATELAERGRAIDAAIEIYVGLILSHIFADANRRTAALAACRAVTRVSNRNGACTSVVSRVAAGSSPARHRPWPSRTRMRQ